MNRFWRRRFVRKALFASTFTASLKLLGLDRNQSLFALYLVFRPIAHRHGVLETVCPASRRKATYRIPQIHWVKGVIHIPIVRLALGIPVFLASIFWIYRLAKVLPLDWPGSARGLITGISDWFLRPARGRLQGRRPSKAFTSGSSSKSPVFGAIGGVIAAGHTSHPLFLLLGAIGTMPRATRVAVQDSQCLATRQASFDRWSAPYPEWRARRHHFLTAVRADVAAVLVLCGPTGKAATAVSIPLVAVIRINGQQYFSR